MNLVGPVFMIVFDDRDVSPEVFGGEQAEEGARARFEQVLTNWNANLFQRIDDGRRPHKRAWTGPGELERTGYIDPPQADGKVES